MSFSRHTVVSLRSLLSYSQILVLIVVIDLTFLFVIVLVLVGCCLCFGAIKEYFSRLGPHPATKSAPSATGSEMVFLLKLVTLSVVSSGAVRSGLTLRSWRFFTTPRFLVIFKSLLLVSCFFLDKLRFLAFSSFCENDEVCGERRHDCASGRD
ncbi:hypothetical protein KCV06_g111, partial [Aureobasidium melanogenum]